MTDPARRLSPVIRLAPAKLNLSLAIVGRRDDGYHSLHSVFVPLALADRLSLAVAGGPDDTLHVTGFDPGPAGDNLVVRALRAARSAVGGGWSGGPAPAPAIAARLDKRIPVAAGPGKPTGNVKEHTPTSDAASGQVLDAQRFKIIGRDLLDPAEEPELPGPNMPKPVPLRRGLRVERVEDVLKRVAVIGMHRVTQLGATEERRRDEAERDVERHHLARDHQCSSGRQRIRRQKRERPQVGVEDVPGVRQAEHGMNRQLVIARDHVRAA